MSVNEYTYSELVAEATKGNAEQEAINALGEWFERFGVSCWNGEAYEVDDKLNLWLYPVYSEDGDDLEIVGYTFSGDQEDRFVPSKEAL